MSKYFKELFGIANKEALSMFEFSYNHETRTHSYILYDEGDQNKKLKIEISRETGEILCSGDLFMVSRGVEYYLKLEEYSNLLLSIIETHLSYDQKKINDSKKTQTVKDRKGTHYLTYIEPSPNRLHQEKLIRYHKKDTDIYAYHSIERNLFCCLLDDGKTIRKMNDTNYFELNTMKYIDDFRYKL